MNKIIITLSILFATLFPVGMYADIPPPPGQEYAPPPRCTPKQVEQCRKNLAVCDDAGINFHGHYFCLFDAPEQQTSFLSTNKSYIIGGSIVVGGLIIAGIGIYIFRKKKQQNPVK